MNNKFDVGIIGAGVAGAFAALRLTEYHKNLKTVLFEFGRPPGKRRRQLEGWFGCFPGSDGKIYPDDIEKVLDLVDGRKTKAINKWFNKQLTDINPSKLVKSKLPQDSVQQKIKDLGFSLQTHNYYQWHPDSIHQLSRSIAERIENAKNLTFSFDNEVFSLLKRGNEFVISTADGDFYCKKIILCVGRSGWRWVNKLFRDLGILTSDDYARYGIRIELAAQYMKPFNKSHCSLTNDDLNIGPFSWSGSIIQEDHADLTISAFRSNEDRWKSDKVFFSIIGKKYFKNSGTYQTDRIGKLAFLLSGDRVGREKIKTLIKNESQISPLPEFNWLPETLEKLTAIVPPLISRGYFHCPDIIPMTSEIMIGNNLETEIDGLFVAGETAGISGIAAAAIMGGLAAEGAVK